MLNGLSIDVEDAFHCSAFEREIAPEDWTGYSSRSPANVMKLLALFERAQVKATFFTLGWVAERHPEVVKAIHAAGHEVACHGSSHRRIYTQTPAVFREDVARCRDLLQSLTGAPVLGYRAPSYSITPQSAWALDVLAELGFQYDSSVFPVHHDRYGWPGAPRFPYRVRTSSGQELVEVPPTSIRVGRINVPVAGGGYFRLYPFGVTRGSIWYLNRVEQRPAFVYLHPWEIDPEQPRLTRRALTWWRHSVNLKRTYHRLERLLGQVPMTSFAALLPELGPLPLIELSMLGREAA